MFEPGVSGNPEGRPKDTPNKVTREVREAFKMLVDNNLDKMQGWLDEVAKDNPALALRIITELAEFCIPKLQRVTIQSPPEERKRPALSWIVPLEGEDGQN